MGSQWYSGVKTGQQITVKTESDENHKTGGKKLK